MADNYSGRDISGGFVTRGSTSAEVAETVRSTKQQLRKLRVRHRAGPKKATRLERTRKLHDVLTTLVHDLRAAGFAAVTIRPGPIAIIGPEILDPKTQGKIGHARESLGVYIQRLSLDENFFQRPPFDHMTDPIYRRLIRDFIEGAAMPESKIAALGYAGGLRSLTDDSIKFSIIDGLQRLYCYLSAILLVWRREQLVQDGLIPEEAWSFFAPSVRSLGGAELATEELLQRSMGFEIFYSVGLGGLLHYMVTFNSSQRRMSLRVQLEIMKKPLIEHLKSEGIPIWEDLGQMPGERRSKDKFLGSDIVLATQAFITNNAHVTKALETERFLDESQPYLDNIGDVSDIVRIFRRISLELQPQLLEVYATDPDRCHVFMNGDPFLLGFVAACGYVRNRSNMAVLDKALDRLLEELALDDDPLNLDAYDRALARVQVSRGKDARRLVDDTFRRFFLGVTTELDWIDTVSQIVDNDLR